MLCALTGRSAGSIWGPACSSRCPWSDTVPNRPPPLWQKGLAVLDPQQRGEEKLLEPFTISLNSDLQLIGDKTAHINTLIIHFYVFFVIVL